MLQESSGVSHPLVAAQTQKPWPVRPGGQATAQGNVVELADQSGRPGLFSSFASVQARGDRHLDSALRLRAADAALQKADALLEAIKERLTHIVKQYPPFSQESPQRISYLNSISGLRQQLDALAFPPEADAVNPGDARSGDEAAPTPRMPARGDLAIPELNPETASDAEVSDALEAVISARHDVAVSRAAMWEDVARFVGPARFSQEADFLAQSRVDAVRGYVIAHPGPGIGFNARAVLASGT